MKRDKAVSSGNEKTAGEGVYNSVSREIDGTVLSSSVSKGDLFMRERGQERNTFSVGKIRGHEAFTHTLNALAHGLRAQMLTRGISNGYQVSALLGVDEHMPNSSNCQKRSLDFFYATHFIQFSNAKFLELASPHLVHHF